MKNTLHDSNTIRPNSSWILFDSKKHPTCFKNIKLTQPLSIIQLQSPSIQILSQFLIFQSLTNIYKKAFKNQFPVHDSIPNPSNPQSIDDNLFSK